MLEMKNHGIYLDPEPHRVGDRCHITYEGLLKKSGADQVYLHYGYGTNWNQVQDIPMFNTEKGAACDLTVEQDGLFNFCFKDSADHWDNNNGHNWSLTIVR